MWLLLFKHRIYLHILKLFGIIGVIYYYYYFAYRMVRTKADAGSTKVAGAKAPRKVLTTSLPVGGTGTPTKTSRY